MCAHDSWLIAGLFLGWQLQFLALQHFGNVKIEEITVQDRLNNSSKDRNEVVVRFVGVAVDPVKDVECSISPQRKQVMARDCFSFTGFRYHEQLWKDCKGLKIDTPGPKHFHERKFVVDNKSQQGHRDKEEFNSE